MVHRFPASHTIYGWLSKLTTCGRDTRSPIDLLRLTDLQAHVVTSDSGTRPRFEPPQSEPSRGVWSSGAGSGPDYF